MMGEKLKGWLVIRCAQLGIPREHAEVFRETHPDGAVTIDIRDARTSEAMGKAATR